MIKEQLRQLIKKRRRRGPLRWCRKGKGGYKKKDKIDCPKSKRTNQIV